MLDRILFEVGKFVGYRIAAVQHGLQETVREYKESLRAEDYAALGLTPSASVEDIVRAYCSKAKTIAHVSPGGNEHLRKLRGAYDRLSHLKKYVSQLSQDDP